MVGLARPLDLTLHCCSFPNGFKAAGATADTLSNIRWGTDYLLKTVNNGAANSRIVYQIGNLTIESQDWSRPWDITRARPAYSLDAASAGADLLGPIVGALASSAIAIGSSDKAYQTTLLTAAQQVYLLTALNAKNGVL